MNVQGVLENCTAEDTATVQAYVQWITDEKEWPEKQFPDGSKAPARNSRSFKLSDGMQRNAPFIWSTYYYRPGDPSLPQVGDYVQAKGVLKTSNNPKPGDPTVFLNISTSKHSLGPVPGSQAGFRLPQDTQEARSPQTQPPPQGQARSAPTQAPSGQNTPSGRQTIPLDVDLKLQVHVYRQLDRQFGMLDDLGQPPAAAEIQAMAVSTMISIHRGEVQVPPATMQALLKQQQPAPPAARQEQAPDHSTTVSDEGGGSGDEDCPF
jgi:hypothetical protein